MAFERFKAAVASTKEDDEEEVARILSDAKLFQAAAPSATATDPERELLDEAASRFGEIRKGRGPLRRAGEETFQAAKKYAVKPAAKLVEAALLKPAVPTGFLRGAIERLPERIQEADIGAPFRIDPGLIEHGPGDPEERSRTLTDVPRGTPLRLSHAALANEFVGPTWADVATFGGTKALTGGLALAGGLADLSRGAKLGSELRVAKQTAARGAFKSATELGQSADEAKKAARKAAAMARTPEPPPTIGPSAQIKLPESGKGIGPLRVISARAAETTDDFLRDIAGKRLIPKEAAEGFANANRNSIHDAQVLENEGTAVLDKLFAPAQKIKGRRGLDAERRLGLLLDKGQSTGEAWLDEIGEKVHEWSLGRFNKTASLVDADFGGPNQKIFPRQFYLPHNNRRLSRAVSKWQKSPGEAEDIVVRLYSEVGETPPPSQEIRNHLAGLYQQRHLDPDISVNPIKSRSSHVEEHRTLDVPGHDADPRRPDYKRGSLFRVYADYNRETANRIADATHFGPGGEKFREWHRLIGNADVQKYFTDLRRRMLGVQGLTPSESLLREMSQELRAYNSARFLGKAPVANSLESTMRGFPLSVKSVGWKGVVNYSRSLVHGLPALWNRGDALAEARRVGAWHDNSLRAIANTEGAGPMSRMADKFIIGMRPTERATNAISNEGGRLWLESLAESLRRGRPTAAQDIRTLLAPVPEMADEAIELARNGEPMTPEILDRFGYEFARRTASRADPTTLPLAWTGEFGESLLQFKKFVYQYNRFIWQDIIGAAAKGDLGPMTAWAATGVVTGSVIRPLRQILAGRRTMDDLLEDDEDLAELQDAIDTHANTVGLQHIQEALLAAGKYGGKAIVQAGGAGFPGELAQAAGSKDFTRIASTLLGPTFGEPLALSKEAMFYKDPVDEILARRLPIGPFVSLAEYGAKQLDFDDIDLDALVGTRQRSSRSSRFLKAAEHAK